MKGCTEAFKGSSKNMGLMRQGILLVHILYSGIDIMIHHTIVMTKEIRVAVTIGRPMVSQFKIRSSPATKGMQLPI